jgi:hypothetical protein
MREILSLVAAAALLAFGGVANAKDPLTLTDSQLDKVTAGASSTVIFGSATPSASEISSLLLASSFGGVLGSQGPLGANGPLGPHGVLPLGPNGILPSTH